MREALAASSSAMHATSSIIRAIEIYREVPRQHRPGGRLEQLQADLIIKQSGLHEEMGSYEYSEDITEHFNEVVNTYTGKSLDECLVGLACIVDPSGIEVYKKQIIDSAREFLFMTMIDTTVHDDEGKIISHIPALDLSRPIDDDDIRVRCGQRMSFEHQISVSCAIRPALYTIMGEHNVDDNLFYLLAQASPFVPSGQEGIFALGLSRFFSGANMEACCLLVPQLENALRYVLKQRGIDVTKITNALTQEDVTLSVLLDRFRTPLEEIFGASTIFQIEMIFHSKHGFNIRNSLAHGIVKDRDFWSASHIFGCWIIYRLMMSPLIRRWPDVKSVIENHGYL